MLDDSHNDENDDDNDNTGLVVINQSSIYGGGDSDNIIEYARNPPRNQQSEIEMINKAVAGVRAENALYIE